MDARDEAKSIVSKKKANFFKVLMSTGHGSVTDHAAAIEAATVELKRAKEQEQIVLSLTPEPEKEYEDYE